MDTFLLTRIALPSASSHLFAMSCRSDVYSHRILNIFDINLYNFALIPDIMRRMAQYSSVEQLSRFVWQNLACDRYQR